MKISLVGSYPPPYGGVSIYVQRMKEWLDRKGVACIVYDTSGTFKKKHDVMNVKKIKKWLLLQILKQEKNILHYQGYSPTVLIFLSLFSLIRRKKIVVTLHSFRYGPNTMNSLDRIAFWLARNSQIYFIAVGPKIKDKIVFLGIKTENVKIVPAFIPPTIKKEEIAEIPQNIWDFIDSHSPVILANAFRISFYNGEDLYGIDMCIDLCANLKEYYSNIGFIFCLPDIGDYCYFNKMKDRIGVKSIKDNFLFQAKPCQLYPILMKSDVFVRPTNTDGDALSLREALHFKIPSVASDIVPRPSGTILFKSRDIDNFTFHVKDVLDNYEDCKNKLENIKLENNAEKILGIYQELSK